MASSRRPRSERAGEQLLALPFDAELAPGARNAVVHCLRIQPEEKVTLITDHACRGDRRGVGA